MPIPVTAQYKAWVYGRSLTGIVNSNPAGGTDVFLLLVLFVVGRGLYPGLITRPEEFYRLYYVGV
jgi:hypothetical protein